MKRKNEIIQAASRLFSEKGYDLSMSDIAEEVGIKPPSLYSHFEGKDEIIGLVLEREMTNLYDFLNQTIDELESESTELKLKKLFFYIFDYFEKPGQLEILKRVPFIDNESLKARFTKIILDKDEGFSVKVKEMIHKGILSGELRENAHEGTMLLYITMIQGLLNIKLLQKSSTSQIDNYTLTAWEAFWDSIKSTK